MEVPYQPPTASTCSGGDVVGYSVPYLAQERQVAQFHGSHKGVFLIERLYSTRLRGRRGLLPSLARKLGRFKVRIIVLRDPALNQ